MPPFADVLQWEHLPFPKSLRDFQRLFHDDDACARYLEGAKWPKGFVCPHCEEKGEPVRLATGLRDNPVASGSLSCRHMDETDADGSRIPRAFAVAHFDSLTRLEDWSESRPTHLRIFGRFIELAQELQGNIQLRLWHEVIVTQANQQLFEYVNCHPLTGVMPYAPELSISTNPYQ